MKPQTLLLLMGLVSIAGASPACAQLRCADGRCQIIQQAAPSQAAQTHSWQQWSQSVNAKLVEIDRRLNEGAKNVSADLAHLNDATVGAESRLAVLERDRDAHAKAIHATAAAIPPVVEIERDAAAAKDATAQHTEIIAQIEARLEEITIEQKQTIVEPAAAPFWWDLAGHAAMLVAAVTGVSVPGWIVALGWRAVGRAIFRRRGTASPAPTLPGTTAESDEAGSTPPESGPAGTAANHYTAPAREVVRTQTNVQVVEGPNMEAVSWEWAAREAVEREPALLPTVQRLRALKDQNLSGERAKRRAA